MSTLRSALDELEGEELADVTDEDLEADFGELERAARVLEAQRLRRLAEIDRRGSYRRDGYLSVSSWLAKRFRLAWSVAIQQVRLGRALRDMPATVEALESGGVSSSAVVMLVRAREGNPEKFAQAEEALVDAPRTLPIRELRQALAYWRQAVDPCVAAQDEHRQFELRRLHVSPTLQGMVRVDGDLDPETGASSPRFGPSRTPTFGPGIPENVGPPPSGGPMPWARSVGPGWTAPIGRWWPGSAPRERDRGPGGPGRTWRALRTR